MILKLGDKVQSDRGVQGAIVRMNDDGRSVMVQLPANGHERTTISLPLARLHSIKEYTRKPYPQ